MYRVYKKSHKENLVQHQETQQLVQQLLSPDSLNWWRWWRVWNVWWWWFIFVFFLLYFPHWRGVIIFSSGYALPTNLSIVFYHLLSHSLCNTHCPIKFLLKRQLTISPPFPTRIKSCRDYSSLQFLIFRSYDQVREHTLTPKS